MTTKRTKPAADEAACPVAPLAREYARSLRALEKVQAEKEARAFIEATTMEGHELGPTPDHARRLILGRQDAIRAIACLRPAISSIGLAFQLLLIYAERDFRDPAVDDPEPLPKATQLRLTRTEDQRQGVVWRAFLRLVTDFSDPDLMTLQEWLGSHALTDEECVDRMLQAAA